MPEFSRRGLFSAVSSLSLLGVAPLLAGCGVNRPGQPNQPTALPAVKSMTPLSLSHIKNILADASTVLHNGDQKRDSGALATRLSGPALEQRKALYRWWSDPKTAPTEKMPTPLSSLPLLVLASESEVWPRNLVVALNGAEEGSRILLAMRQVNARSSYQIWAGVRVLNPKPGQSTTVIPDSVALPKASPGVGLDDTTLVRTPREVVLHYLSLLQQGDESPFRAEFLADGFQDSFRAEINSYRTPIDKVTGKRIFADPQVTLTPDFTQFAGFSMPQGGAVFLCAVMTVMRIVNQSGMSVNLPAKLQTLSGAVTFNSNLEITNNQVAAFFIPEAGSSEPVRCIGMDADLGDGLGVGKREGVTAIVGPGDKFGTITAKVNI